MVLKALKQLQFDVINPPIDFNITELYEFLKLIHKPENVWLYDVPVIKRLSNYFGALWAISKGTRSFPFNMESLQYIDDHLNVADARRIVREIDSFNLEEGQVVTDVNVDIENGTDMEKLFIMLSDYYSSQKRIKTNKPKYLNDTEYIKTRGTLFQGLYNILSGGVSGEKDEDVVDDKQTFIAKIRNVDFSIFLLGKSAFKTLNDTMGEFTARYTGENDTVKFVEDFIGIALGNRNVTTKDMGTIFDLSLSNIISENRAT
jgi:hypothetical protein